MRYITFRQSVMLICCILVLAVLYTAIKLSDFRDGSMFEHRPEKPFATNDDSDTPTMPSRTADKPRRTEPFPAPGQLLLDDFIVHPRMTQTQRDALPNLSELQWPPDPVAPYPIGQKLAKPPEPFEPVLSRGQRALFKHLLNVFTELLRNHSLGDRFFLMGGTLLGSLRHHELIPWDDDVDLLLDKAVLPVVQRLVKSLEPDYLMGGIPGRVKFYAKLMKLGQESEDLQLSRRTSKYPWGWPNLDIGFYEFNASHVWEEAIYHGKKLLWPKSVVFPLMFRPLGLNWFPTPNNIIRFIRLTGNLDGNCIVSRYNHIYEYGIVAKRKPCKQLASQYAFVQHSQSSKQLFTMDNEHGDLLRTMFVVNEKLFILSPDGRTLSVYHTIQLPGHSEQITLDTYDYGRNNV